MRVSLLVAVVLSFIFQGGVSAQPLPFTPLAMPTSEEVAAHKKEKADSIEKLITIFDRVENTTIHFKKLVIKDSTIQATASDVEKNIFGFKLKIIKNVTEVDSSTITIFAGTKPVPNSGKRNPDPMFDTIIDPVGVNIAKGFDVAARIAEVKKALGAPILVLPVPQIPPPAPAAVLSAKKK
jgi:hypothetical protein